MKITLGELTLLPVSFLVATLLVAVPGSIFGLAARGPHPLWTWALQDVTTLRVHFRVSPSDLYTPADIDTVNQYFNQSLEELPRFSELKGLDNHFDPWGNPYVCVERQEDTDERYRPWHFYSTGRDGTSATNGNDADDISSWRESEEVATYYYRESQKTRRAIHALLGLVFCPVVFPFLVFMKRRYFGKPFQAGRAT
jgi:hypothetical protein